MTKDRANFRPAETDPYVLFENIPFPVDVYETFMDIFPGQWSDQRNYGINHILADLSTVTRGGEGSQGTPGKCADNSTNTPKIIKL